MIKTDEWTIAELTKYLVSVKSTLTADELDRLRATVAFPKEPGKDASEPEKKRFRAKELYEPNDTLRALGLPIIDWGKQNKWKQNSEEGEIARFQTSRLVIDCRILYSQVFVRYWAAEVPSLGCFDPSLCQS